MDYLVVIGKHLGYPECCIKAFGDGRAWIAREEEVKKVTNNSGFIPCLSCARRILAGEIEMKDLIKDRKHSLPFPEQDQKELDELYHNFLKSRN